MSGTLLFWLGLVFGTSLQSLAYWLGHHVSKKDPAPDAVRRQIVAWNPQLPPTYVVELECGHRVTIAVHRIQSCQCEVCTREISELQKISGAK